ncbi:MAG: hypothetical protein MK102_12735 [Fuerstiella sp.]|nr:hypothetical protein [Fuerstiella sp.]
MQNSNRVVLVGLMICTLGGWYGGEEFFTHASAETVAGKPNSAKRVAPGTMRPQAGKYSAGPSDQNRRRRFFGFSIPNLDLFAGVFPGLRTGPAYSHWQDQHFEMAVRMRSPIIPEAINARAASAEDQLRLVALLKKLLDVSLEPPLINEAVPTPGTQQVNVGLGTPRGKRGRHINDEDDDVDDDDSNAVPRASTGMAPSVPIQKYPWGNNPNGPGAEEEVPAAPVAKPSSSRRGRRRSTVNDEVGQERMPVIAKRVFRPRLSNRQVFQAIVRGLVACGSEDAEKIIHSVVKGQQKTSLNLKQASVVVFEEVFGARSINSDMAERLAVAIVDHGDHDFPSMELLLALGSRVARADLHLKDAAVDLSTTSGTQQVNAGLGTPRGKRGRHINDEDDDVDDDDSGAAPTGYRPGAPTGMAPGSPTGMAPGSPTGMAPGSPTGMAPTARYATGAQAGGASSVANVVSSPSTHTGIQLAPGAIEGLTPIFRHRTLITAVKNRLNVVRDLSAGQSVLSLASVLPSPTLRHSTFQLFQEHHDEGADVLLSSGFYGMHARDPGHLLVLKSLPRLRKPPSGKRKTQAPDPAHVSWVYATWDMVRVLRDQLNESAFDPQIAWEGALNPEPYRNARLEVATEVVIRDEAEDSQNTLGETRVYYTRSTLTPRDDRERKAISDHYLRAARAIRREIPEEDVLWFDGVRTNSDGLRTSFDVTISSRQASVSRATSGGMRQPTGGAGYRRTNSQNRSGQTFTVESIAVVAADPRNPVNVEKIAQSD